MLNRYRFTPIPYNFILQYKAVWNFFFYFIIDIK
nr:MAG TPA: hypothetical protein [Caudoviricetes sp.]